MECVLLCNNKKSLASQGFRHVAYGRTDGDRTHDPYPVKMAK